MAETGTKGPGNGRAAGAAPDGDASWFRTASWLRAAPWAAFIAASLSAALSARYLFIESTEIGLGCQVEALPWYCAIRGLLISFNLGNGWGWLAMAGGGLAVVTHWRAGILLGLACGSAGLVLYNAGPAGVGLLLALLALVRR